MKFVTGMLQIILPNQEVRSQNRYLNLVFVFY